MQTKLTLPRAIALSVACLKQAVLPVLFISCTLGVSAQKGKNANPNLPAFGQVDKADLQMKDCDFENKAEAMVLLDDGVLQYINGVGLELNRRIRIKILSSKGLEWANVHLPYRTVGNSQFISGLEAQTYNVDGNGNMVVAKVDKKLIYDKKLSKRTSERVFTFPEAKVGSIIEYKYIHSDVGLIDWYFQKSIPVRYSRFVIDFPSEVEVAVTPFCAHQYETVKEDRYSRTMTTYTMSKVPSFHDEPYIINEDHYRDRLETKVVAYELNGRRNFRVVNWVQVIRALMEDEDFGSQIKKNIPRTDDLNAMLKNTLSPYEKMKIIYKYVQDKMQWNEYVGIWALDGVKSAWKDKKGTAGEINLILVNLLKEAGLNVHPILVSTHDNGVVNTVDAGTMDYPGYNQFNKVMAYLVLDGNPYVLDATQKNTPVHLIPAEILMTQGLVIEKIDTYEWGWKTLWKDEAVAKTTVVVNAAIDAAGKMEGQADIISYDYARLARIGTVKKGKEKYIAKYITEPNAALQVDEVSFNNVESDSLPLLQKIKFNQSLNSVGDYKYFSLNLLSGLEVNPFVADNRASDVFFGYNQKVELLGNFVLPEGFKFDELPKNMRMIMPDTSITISRLSQVYDNRLQTKVVVEFKKPVFEVGEYEYLQEFYQRLFEILNEQFVIRKKS